MVERIRVDHNTDDVRRLLRTLPERFVRPATHQALNRTLLNARTEFSKRVRKRVSLKASVVKDATKLRKATRQDLYAEISWHFEPISLKRYGNVRQTKKGVKVTQLKGQRDLIKHAFVSEQLGGHVFRRDGEKRPPTKGRYADKRTKAGEPYKRQPIKKLFGPSMISQAKIIVPGMRDWVQERMVENTRQASNRYLALARRKATAPD